MTTLFDKVEGRTKQLIGEMLGDGRLFAEGDRQARTLDQQPPTVEMPADSNADTTRPS